MPNLSKTDPKIADLVRREQERQASFLNMIPSENFASPAVREAAGSVFAHKYSEGNIGKRYYEGNEVVDELEQLTIDRASEFFGLPKDWSVNVQALSGSNANLAVYLALLEIGDTVMGMYLPDGGHLSHGWSYEPGEKVDPADPLYAGGKRKVNVTSKIFNTIQYKTDPKTQLFDYDEVEKIAQKHKPKLVISGGTAYPQEIDHERMRQIADSVGAYYLADIAHEAGLVGAGVINSPVGIADVVTMTTHKTLRATRGALILGRKELIKKIDRSILPGLQGGPFNHAIAGIAVALGEALTPEYKQYAEQVVANAKAFAAALADEGFEIVSGGVAKHLILVDLSGSDSGIYGKYAARALAIAGVVANMNTIPGEQRSPANPSGIRFGTPFLTTQGMKEEQMRQIAGWISKVLEIIKPHAELDFAEFQEKIKADKQIQEIRAQVKSLCEKFPLEF